MLSHTTQFKNFYIFLSTSDPMEVRDMFLLRAHLVLFSGVEDISGLPYIQVPLESIDEIPYVEHSGWSGRSLWRSILHPSPDCNVSKYCNTIHDILEKMEILSVLEISHGFIYFIYFIYLFAKHNQQLNLTACKT